MNARARPTGFTYEDYVLFPNDGKRHELIEGEHVVTPAPGTRHQRILANLLTGLRPFVLAEHLGEALPAPVDVVLSDRDVVQPDLLFVSTEHLERLTDRGVRGAPDLVVEITSETSRRMDEVVKRKLYEAHGVREYWVIDPDLDVIKVYRLAETSFVRAAELSLEANDTLTSPLLPGLELRLATIFA